MRRAGRILGWTAAILVAVPVLLVAILIGALNTGAGQREAVSLLNGALGGQVHLAGLSGRFPDRLRLAAVSVSDANGPWLTARGVVLDWSPLALLHGTASVQSLHADQLRVARLPHSGAAKPTATTASKTSHLPVRVRIARLSIGRADLGPALPGGPAALHLDGSASLDDYTVGSATLAATRLDGTGTYHVAGSLGATTMTLAVTVEEPAGGLVAHAANLPDLGPLAVAAHLDGPGSHAALDAHIAAGPLRLAATGALDLVDNSADLAIQANAPAMTPRPGLHWASVALDARVRGPFTRPQAHGTLRLDGLTAAGAAIGKLRATVQGNKGQVRLHATAHGLRIPGPDPALLAASPLTLDLDAQLDAPGRPVRFTLAHALLTAKGHATTAGTIIADADLTLPDLAPFARLGGVAVAGQAALHLHAVRTATTAIDASGTVSLTQAPGPAVALLGPDARFNAAGTLAGAEMSLTRLDLTGRTIALHAHGALAGKRLDAAAHIALGDLAAAAPTLAGHATVDATAHGPLADLAATLDAKGLVGTKGFAPAPVEIQATAQHLPGAPTGTIQAHGTLDGAPLALDVAAKRDATGTLAATIDSATWRSLAANGALTLAPGATLPQGQVRLRIGTLADLRAFTGQALAGRVQATANLGATTARLQAHLSGITVPGAHIGRATLDATVTDPLGARRVQARLVADGVSTGSIAGHAQIDADGPQDALALRVKTGLQVQGTPVRAQGEALLNVPAKSLTLNALQVAARGQTMRLLAPARVSFGQGVAVNRLRLAASGATLDLAGRLSPALDATVHAQLPGSLAGLVNPAYALDGSARVDATVRGTPARPTGMVHLLVRGLHMRQGEGRAAPPLNATLTAQLLGTAARVQGQVNAGSAHLALSGTAPIAAGGALDMRAKGGFDLALLNPIVSPAGRRVQGRLTLDARAAGTVAAPRLSGQVALASGEVQDFAQGVHLTAISGRALLHGDQVTIPGITAHAGPGTIAISGHVGALQRGIPVDLTIRLVRARPLASDLLTADLGGSVTLGGSVGHGLQVGGTIDVLRASIQVPEQLPASVQSLDVIRPGQKPVPQAAPVRPVRLHLGVRATGPIFVRGHGLDAVLGGGLHVSGTSAAPQVSGGFDMRRGTFSLAGTTLTFTKGRVSFEGTGVSDRIDPSLNFVATSSTTQVTATLTVGGTASKPKITLSSVPELPQDEVLAYLLFKRSAKSLGPFQLAEIAAALAEVSGVGGGGLNPLNRIRKGLGLDQLNVSGGSGTGAGSKAGSPSIEAGRYVANGVYVGAKQSTTGQGTGAQVRIDLTKRLKLDTDVGSGQGGNQVGLTYQLEW